MSDLEIKFDDLKSELSKHYEGENYKLLKFCLFDYLKVGDLTTENSIGHILFNKLDSTGGPGVIKANDVNLLLEITRLIGPKDAEDLVLKYIEDNNIRNRPTNYTLSEYRKQLFKAVKQAEPLALLRVTAKYRLEHLNYSNLWDIIFKLETDKILPEKLKTFTSLLGKSAQKELQTDNEVDEDRTSIFKFGGASTSKRVRTKDNIASGSDSDGYDESVQARKQMRKMYSENSLNDGDDSNTRTSTSRFQATREQTKEEKIEVYLLERKKDLCSNAKNFTPAILNKRYKFDLSELFTELDLLKENDQKRNSKPTTLREVLPIIKDIPGCKVLIDGEGGIGKTTLLRHMALNAATDESFDVFKGFFIMSSNLDDLNMQDCDISGDIINDMIIKCFDTEGEWGLVCLDISFNNLSGINGTSLGRFNPVRRLEMQDCTLSGDIMNAMIKKFPWCLSYLNISSNNLSDINGTSLGYLIMSPNLYGLNLYDCNLSGDIINDMTKECSDRGVELRLSDLNISSNNLSDIDGTSLGYLIMSPNLYRLDMYDCNLSGDIINDVIKECSDRGVELRLSRLNISHNNLSDIDGTLLRSLFTMSPKLNVLSMYNCNLSADIINAMCRDCSERERELLLCKLRLT
ncbi:uncharacterized protein [Antedon mediterranea]|uniref:uncharacterized protein n=1 Tax=Antedon mediterranea TaxID=105859 RepID=UPI003AF4C6E6